MSKRSSVIDTARGIGIVLVVFGHNWIIAHDHGALFRVVFSFHMPLFFFLAGLFLRPTEGINTFVSSRADSLLKPYLVVLGAWGVLRLIVANIPVLPYFMGVLYGTGFTIEWVPLWFLPHLFVSLLLVLALMKWATHFSSPRRFLAWSMLICLLSGWYAMTWLQAQQWQDMQPWYAKLNHLTTEFPGLPWSLDLVGISAAFVLAGFLAREAVLAFRFHWRNTTLVGAVFAACHLLYGQTMDLHMREYGNPVISSLQAVAGIYLSISLAAFIQRFESLSKGMMALGQASLFILIFHSWIEWKVFGLLQHHGIGDDVAALIALFLGVVLPALLWRYMSLFPWLAALLLPKKNKVSSS